MTEKTAPTIRIDIFIAGDLEQAKHVCREFCLEVGLCVTVEPVAYVYTGGEEAGVRIGLINYPRFPTTFDALMEKAGRLADRLMIRLYQQSYSIVTPTETVWVSRRPEDAPPSPQPNVALPETENRSERQSIKHNSVLSSDLETLSVDDVVCEDLLGDHLASSEDGFIVGNIKRGELQPHRVLLENIVPSDVEIVSGHAGSIELSDSNRNDAPRFQSSPLAPAQHVAGPQPCGIADPSTRDCPNMKEVGGGMDGERYRCDVCGKGYFLDYEEMK